MLYSFILMGDWGRGQCSPGYLSNPFPSLPQIYLSHMSPPAFVSLIIHVSDGKTLQPAPPVVLTSLCLSLLLNRNWGGGWNFYQNQNVHRLKMPVALCELDCKQLSSSTLQLGLTVVNAANASCVPEHPSDMRT